MCMTVPVDLKLFMVVGILARFPIWALRIPIVIPAMVPVRAVEVTIDSG
jgi:hypothetical protein